MPWNGVRTAVAGELETAANYNTYVRDNLAFLRGNPAQYFRGLFVRTHPDYETTLASRSKVQLQALDEVVMNDGTRYSGFTLPMECDLAASGAGGHDTGARVAATWYELYLIGKSSTGLVGDCRLLFHRHKNYATDAAYGPSSDVTRALRVATSTATDKLAQGFQPITGGRVDFVDISQIRSAGAPSGRIWLTIEADSGGNPSGSPIATSDKMNAGGVPSTLLGYLRFIFRTAPTLTAGTQYHLVLQGDYTRSDTVFVAWGGTVANGYASGSAKQYNGATWSAATGVGDFQFIVNRTENDTAVTLPAGYDQRCFLGYWFNTSSNALPAMWQRERHTSYMTPSILSSAITWTAPALMGLQPGSSNPGIPMVPVTLFMQGSQANAADVLTVAGVPDGYDSSIGVKLAAGIGALPPFATEMQTIYAFTSAGTAGLSLAGFQF